MFAQEAEAGASVAAGWFLEHAWLIPLIPSVAFAVIIFFGKKIGKPVANGAYIGIASMFASFVLAAGTAYQWIQRVGDAGEGVEVEPVIRKFTWWSSGGLKFGLGEHIDGLAVVLLLLVAFISTLVQIYSLEYVRGDRRYTHFFAALTLFSSGMLTMVLAENTVQLILGWEIMGLCSFMLIGHWWEEEPNALAALKAFFTVRVGDVGLLVGVATIFFGANSWAQENLHESGFSIRAIHLWVASGTGSHSVLLWGSVALFIACIGKSGQFPLHTWLPDAMAGPTPVSSLLHSSTMVVAGVFLVARLYPVFHTGLAINVAGHHFNLIAVIGGITILIAAGLAFVQNDIKKVLAYSTVSQLGYMMMGLGVGAWTPAVFHIFTHAFFKCCLFLCAGSVSHTASHHSFDMKKDMGGIARKMPVTFVAWIVSTAALCGVPFITSGFFSKDEIIDSAKHNDYKVFFVVGLVGAFMTTAYMTRATYLTFFGKPRGGAAHFMHADDHSHGEVHADEHAMAGVHAGVAMADADGPTVDAHAVGALGHGDAHAGSHSDDHGDDHGGGYHAPALPFAPSDSPWPITVPLIILGFLAVVAGYLNAGIFHIEKFHEWVHSSIGVELPEGPAATIIAALPSTLMVAAGFIVSLFVCKAVFGEAPSPLKGLTKRVKPLGWFHNFLVNKYYLDHLYEKVIVKGLVGPIAAGAYWINQNVIDGIVNGAGKSGRRTGEFVYKYIDQGLVDGIVNGSGAVSQSAGGALQPAQSGKVNQYGALLFAAAAVAGLVLVIVNS